MTRFLIWNGCLWNFIVGFPQINFDIFFSLQNVIVLDLSQDISSTTTSTTTTTATTDSPIGVGNNVLSGKTKKQTKDIFFIEFSCKFKQVLQLLGPQKSGSEQSKISCHFNLFEHQLPIQKLKYTCEQVCWIDYLSTKKP